MTEDRTEAAQAASKKAMPWNGREQMAYMVLHHIFSEQVGSVSSTIVTGKIVDTAIWEDAFSVIEMQMLESGSYSIEYEHSDDEGGPYEVLLTHQYQDNQYHTDAIRKDRFVGMKRYIRPKVTATEDPVADMYIHLILERDTGDEPDDADPDKRHEPDPTPEPDPKPKPVDPSIKLCSILALDGWFISPGTYDGPPIDTAYLSGGLSVSFGDQSYNNGVLSFRLEDSDEKDGPYEEVGPKNLPVISGPQRQGEMLPSVSLEEHKRWVRVVPKAALTRGHTRLAEGPACHFFAHLGNLTNQQIKYELLNVFFPGISETTVHGVPIDTALYSGGIYFVFGANAKAFGKGTYTFGIEQSDRKGGPYEDVGPENLIFSHGDALPVITAGQPEGANLPCVGMGRTQRWVRVRSTVTGYPNATIAVFAVLNG